LPAAANWALGLALSESPAPHKALAGEPGTAVFTPHGRTAGFTELAPTCNTDDRRSQRLTG
jgi:hypothetical protein